MNEIKLPKVEIPERGLSDIFITLMAKAMNVSKEEAEIIINNHGNRS